MSDEIPSPPQGSLLLDIKPYVPEFDAYPSARAGWFEDAGRPGCTVADDRFREEASPTHGSRR